MIVFALLATSSFPAYANGNIPNMTSQQQSVDMKVEIVDSPSTEDRDWLIIGTEQYQQTNQFTGKADYFCTCDDKLLRNSKNAKDLAFKVINPVDLVQEIEK